MKEYTEEQNQWKENTEKRIWQYSKLRTQAKARLQLKCSTYYNELA